jgi:antitoxin MazE
MRLQLAKWGNSLAVRLPADCVRSIGLKEGDELDAAVTPAGEIVLAPARDFNKQDFLERVGRLRAGMATSAPVVERLRAEERY